MARESNMSKLNGTLLKNELKKRGVSLVATSREIGRSESYLSVAINTGIINNSCMKLLKHIYNIDPELYLIPEEEPGDRFELEAVEEETLDTAINAEKLYKIIHCAVYNAFKKAFGEMEEPFNGAEL